MFPSRGRNLSGSSHSSISIDTGVHPQIKALLKTISPLIRWGFLVSGGLLLLFLAGRSLWSSRLAANWDVENPGRQAHIAERVQSIFRSRIDALAAAAATVANNKELLRAVTSNDPERVIEGNRRLSQYKAKESLSLLVLDPKGTPLAWSGRRMVVDTAPFVGPRSGDTVLVLSRMELRSSVSAGVATSNDDMMVVVSEPLELDVPISNRFIGQQSLLRDIAEEIGQSIRILSDGNAVGPSDGGSMRVELDDFRDRPVAVALVSLPTVEEELQVFQNSVDAWIGLLASILVLMLGFVAGRKILAASSQFVRVAGLIVILWGVRFTLLRLETPSLLVGGMLFDPTVFASPIAFGLASSLGETLISVLALLGTILVLARETPLASAGSKRLNVLFLVTVPVLAMLIVLALRAYGATLRSFVYDSTIRYVDPAAVIPDQGLLIMYAIVILFTWALLLFLVFGVAWMMSIVRRSVPGRSGPYATGIILIIYSLCVLGFSLLNRVPQFPGYFPFLAIGCALAIFQWIEVRDKGALWFLDPAGLSVLMLSTFVLSVPVLDQKVHDKENDRLRVHADEVVRPVDAWLSFVVSESFRSMEGSFQEIVGEGSGVRRGTAEIAFPVWSETLLSREGYNSAIVLYTVDGVEMSRFSVGLTNYEQTQLLTRLFDVAEERLNVVERRVPEGLIKYYGMWGTLRNERGQPAAIAAVVLSASERALFRGEASELLRTLGPKSADLFNRRILISEYQNGDLLATNDETLTPGSALDPLIRNSFASNQQKYLEREEISMERTFEALYVRDESQPDRIVCLRMEAVGLRWHVYNTVKVALAFAATALCAGLILLAVQWRRYRAIVFGFRGKLLVAFLIIAIIPLIVLGYYNREFATERQNVNTSKRLNEDLDLVRQRVISSISEADDFDYGINSDYCETVASDYGIDFTVYRRSEMHASSKPELYQSGILDSRLPGIVFAQILVAGKEYVQTSETIGDVAYAVGYKPLVLNGVTLGVLSVPTLYRQQEVEAELAERNAFTLGVYGILLVLTTIAGVVLANQLSQPIRDLTAAARKVGEGKLDVQLPVRGSGEIPELIGTFNEMVQELKKSREELSRAEREMAWKEMAKQVAHEIRNPLTPMKLSVQHLRQAFKDKAKNLGALVDDVTQTITDQIDSLARIASEFSNFARMPERRFERVNLHHLLKDTVQLFSEVRGIEFTAIFCDTDPILIADRDELGRVFVNIVRNSVQAMEQGGTITVKTEIRDHRCHIQFRDTGAGIPPHLVTKVFQPNFSTKSDGMGLGLAIVRKVIEDLNGTIEVKSTVGVGTTMEIMLPLQPGPHA